MSAQAGVFYFDRRPLDLALIGSIGDALERFGPDGGGHYTAAGLALIHRAQHVTAEDVHEQQPLRSRTGAVITWDGRLDNRDDLLLELWRDIGDDKTDIALALATYEKWGIDGFARLIGDWSLVVWNERAGELVFATDYAGNRGLYYREDEHGIQWSTSQTELVARLNLTGELEGRFLVGFLASAAPSTYTPHRGIRSVSPGHALSWRTTRERAVNSLWQMPTDTIVHKNPAEYAVRLRELFADAVATRLRATHPVWAELSGGFDSSAIVCMADRLVSSGRVARPLIETVSYVTSAALEADERPFMRAVEEQRGKATHYVRADLPIADDPDDASAWMISLYDSDMMTRIRRAACTRGARVLMSGQPGDAIMVNAPKDTGAVVEALESRQLWTALVQAHAWSRSSRMTIWELVKRVCRQYWPFDGVHQTVRARLGSGSVHRRGKTAAIIADAYHFTETAVAQWCADLEDQTRRAQASGKRSKRFTINSLIELTDERYFETLVEYAPVTCTFPYMHRPLVEYMLSIPAGATWEAGVPRALMRRAFAGFLPERITNRIGKGLPTSFATRTAQRELSEFTPVERLAVVQRGYVDPRRLERTFALVRSGACTELKNLELVIRLERWLRSHQSSNWYAQQARSSEMSSAPGRSASLSAVYPAPSNP